MMFRTPSIHPSIDGLDGEVSKTTGGDLLGLFLFYPLLYSLIEDSSDSWQMAVGLYGSTGIGTIVSSIGIMLVIFIY